MPAADSSEIVLLMSAIPALPSGKPRPELDFAAREAPCIDSAVDADEGDCDDAADSPMYRESFEAGADGIFPGYPLS